MSELLDPDALHAEAMRLAEQALAASRRGEVVEERALFTRAFEVEREAALQFVTAYEAEPMRAVLFRSAAALALDAGKFREAERMAALGLGGMPPEPIAEELRRVLDEAKFERHLGEQGIELLPNEMKIAMADGDLIGWGIVSSSELISRVRKVETLAQRTVARRNGIPFRDGAPLPKPLAQQFQSYVAAPEAGSFSFRLRIGAAAQLGLFEGTGVVALLDEVAELIQIATQGDLDRLAERVPDETYRRNVMHLARDIAPDGKRVQQVALITQHHAGAEAIRLPVRAEIPRPSVISQDSAEEPSRIEQYIGVLKVANGRQNRISIDQPVAGGRRRRAVQIDVPRGLLSDVVKPYFDEEVVVTARVTGDKKELIDVEPFESGEEKEGP